MTLNIRQHTESLFRELANFKLSYDVSRYLSERANSSWRDFEDEQHENYPIKGCGIIASRELVKEWSLKNESLLHSEEDLAPEETGSEIDSFPRDTVSAIYIFSLLEAFGNTLCDDVYPNYRRAHQAWHHGVYGDADLGDQEALEKMENNFQKPFKTNEPVPTNVIHALVDLKRDRNLIVHQLKHIHDFEIQFRSVVVIASFLCFACDDSCKEIKVYPWDDLDGKFSPLTKRCS